MYIFRQSRYVALLLGAILVCIGAICLLGQNLYSDRSENGEGARLQSYLVTGSVSNAVGAVSDRMRTKQGERLSEPILPQLITLEIKGRYQATGISPSLQIRELISEKITLREKSKEAINKEPVSDKLNPPKELFFTRTELLTREDKEDATWSYVLNEKELLLLQKIVMAEAEGEPYEGKVAVANVVLNRLRSANYPDTIKEVIYQKSQFSPVWNGRLNKVKPDEDTVHAVNEALNGRKEVSDDTYYFLSLKLATDLTIARTKHEAKVIGNHTFYK